MNIITEFEEKKREIWESETSDLSDLIDSIKEQVWAQAQASIENNIGSAEDSMTTENIENIENIIKNAIEKTLDKSLADFVVNLGSKLDLEHDKSFIKLYSHHQNQFDKYLQSLTKAREVNQLLRDKIKLLEKELDCL